MTEDLNILIEGCCQYNRLSQEKMYQYFFTDLVLLCRKFFDDKHDMVTAMNNGMLNVFNNIHKYDSSKGELKAWVFIVVRNACVSYLRQQKLIPTTQELDIELQLEHSTNPLANYNEDFVYHFLKTLTTSTRTVFNLFYLEDLRIKEVAILLNMKEGTVKWHLNDGRNKLKKHFEAIKSRECISQ